MAAIRKTIQDLEKLLNPEDGNTVLHLAAEKNLQDVVRYLIDARKMNPNATNASHDTPVHLAAKSGSREVLLTLVDAKANLNSMNRDGNTALRIITQK